MKINMKLPGSHEHTHALYIGSRTLMLALVMHTDKVSAGVELAG